VGAGGRRERRTQCGEQGSEAPVQSRQSQFPRLTRNAKLTDGLPDSDWRPWSCANSIFIAGTPWPFLRLMVRLIALVQRPCGTYEG
jgi:hypothetical protein